jgi:hypothetical protein
VLLSLTIALLLAGAAFGLARSSHSAQQPPPSLDRLPGPPALMPRSLPPKPDRRTEVGESFDSPVFGAGSALSRSFAEVRRDEAASMIEGRSELISTQRKVLV